MRSRVNFAVLAAVSGCILILAACGGTSTTGPSTASAPQLISSQRNVVSGSVTLHVQTYGPAHPAHTVIVVQGGPGLSLVAAEPYQRLANATRQVVLYDQRGAGASSRPGDGNYGITAQVDDLEAVRASSGAARVDLVGDSFGGMIASAYVATHPDLVQALVLVDAVPLDVAEYDAGTARLSARIAALQAQGIIPKELPPNQGDSCLPAFDAIRPIYLADPHSSLKVDVGSCSASASSLTHAQVDAEGPQISDLGSRLASYRGKALVVMGQADPLGRPSFERNLALLSGARTTQDVIANAGHQTAEEQPGVLFPTVEAFLSGADG